jgi:hypothetical protein
MALLDVLTEFEQETLVTNLEAFREQTEQRLNNIESKISVDIN